MQSYRGPRVEDLVTLMGIETRRLAVQASPDGFKRLCFQYRRYSWMLRNVATDRRRHSAVLGGSAIHAPESPDRIASLDSRTLERFSLLMQGDRSIVPQF